MTRRNKRYRNKSSPQTTSSPKKQRSHTPDKQPGLVEQTESDISDLSNLSNPSSDIVTPTPASFADMATADQSQSQVQTIISQTADNSNSRSLIFTLVIRMRVRVVMFRTILSEILRSLIIYHRHR